MIKLYIAFVLHLEFLTHHVMIFPGKVYDKNTEACMDKCTITCKP